MAGFGIAFEAFLRTKPRRNERTRFLQRRASGLCEWISAAWYHTTCRELVIARVGGARRGPGGILWRGEGTSSEPEGGGASLFPSR